MVAERPPKDHRRVVGLWAENQGIAVACDSCMQCIGFQGICDCHKEGTKWYAVGLTDNPQRREKECGNVLIRKCVNVGMR